MLRCSTTCTHPKQPPHDTLSAYTLQVGQHSLGHTPLESPQCASQGAVQSMQWALNDSYSWAMKLHINMLLASSTHHTLNHSLRNCQWHWKGTHSLGGNIRSLPHEGSSHDYLRNTSSEGSWCSCHTTLCQCTTAMHAAGGYITEPLSMPPSRPGWAFALPQSMHCNGCEIDSKGSIHPGCTVILWYTKPMCSTYYTIQIYTIH